MRYSATLALCAACCLSSGLSLAQADSIPDRPLVPPADSTRIDGVRLAIVSGTFLGVISGIQVYQANGWWKNNRRSFHFQEDLTYGLHVDKIGHFYGASALTFVMGKSFEWAQFSKSDAIHLGAASSVLFQTFVEVQDGFSTWGFDRVDFAMNVAGALLPVAKHHFAPLNAFDLKFSYLPSKNINAPGAFPGQKHLLMDDYEGQTFWASLKVNQLLPEQLEHYWPDFLCVTAGYGGRDILTDRPYRVYFIGLDLDMTQVIPDDTWFLKTLGEALNFIRLPAPAVRISPTVIWYGLYF